MTVLNNNSGLKSKGKRPRQKRKAGREFEKLKYKKAAERLGRRIQKVRQNSGLTQEQLAEKARKSVTWIGYVESGYRLPNIKFLYEIAKVLGVKVKDFFPF